MFKKGNTPWNKSIKRPKFSKEWRENMAKSKRGRPSSMLGKKHSQETKNKIAETLKRIGRKPPPRKIKVESKPCLKCGTIIHRQIGRSSYTKQKYCSMKCRGLARRTDKKKCINCKKELSINAKSKCRICWSKDCSGNKSGAWKGGITPKNKLARTTKQALNWRKKVFERDNYICQECKKRGGKLNAHHIKSFSKNIKERWKLKNGITLCIDCHKKTDNYGFKALKE